MLLLLVGVVAKSLHAEELVFGVAVYCPYVCETAEDPNSEFPGYQAELLYDIAQR